MNPTRNNLPLKVRKEMIALLNARLADAIDLGIQAKQAHWNVKGMEFMQLHPLFDQLAECAYEWSDTIAERAVALGGNAEGTVEAVGKATTLARYPLNLTDGKAHLERLAAALATFGEQLRGAIDRADELEDKGTADVFTEVSRGTDKNLWFIEAHLQK
jgi:starvation-inducible DNA-binding protein